MTLLVIGSVALDSVETPAGRVEDALGGSASYCSVAASFFDRRDQSRRSGGRRFSSNPY